MNARAVEVVSANVANATTEGYATRRLDTTPQTLGGSGAGVRVLGIDRQVDLALLSERRLSEANYQAANALASFSRDLEAVIGLPTEQGSLNNRFTEFEGSLINAIARPENEIHLQDIVTTADSAISKIREIADHIVEERQSADQEIARTINRLNQNLEEISELNEFIIKGTARDIDVSSHMDQRQMLIDEVSKEIPTQVFYRDNGDVMLLGYGGITLLDGVPSEFSFTPRNVIEPQHTIENGALSGLIVNGQPIDVHADQSPLRDGRLNALFEVRDRTAPSAQARIDAVARDLVERFQDPGVDPTLGATDPGLFTDGGGFFDPVNEVGLSRRLMVNAAVDPAQGGELWRLRDGLGATTVGPVGNSAQLQSFLDAFTANRVPNSGDFATVAQSAIGFSSDYLSITSLEREGFETQESYAGAQLTALTEEELKLSVDTDYEMQLLLEIEQAYAANARVIEVAGEMLDMIRGI